MDVERICSSNIFYFGLAGNNYGNDAKTAGEVFNPFGAPPSEPPGKWGAATAGEVFTYQIKGAEFKLNFIPAGEFWMGSKDGGPEEDEDEMPRHQVRITRPFQMAQTPITQAQWSAIMGSNPSHFTGANLHKYVYMYRRNSNV